MNCAKTPPEHGLLPSPVRRRKRGGGGAGGRTACTRSTSPPSRRRRQRRDPPDILLTTPEQVALLLASPDAPYLFSTLRRVVLDELHALVSSKRSDLLPLGAPPP